MMKLCYLANVLENLNQLHLSLQGENTNIFALKSKIEAFMKKVNIWQQKTETDTFEMFPFTDNFVASNDVELGAIKPIVISLLTSLKENFRKYFFLELDNAKLEWIQNLFFVQNQDIEHLPLNSQEEFAELSSHSRLRQEFAQIKLSTFWLKAKTEFPTLSDLAVCAILPFVSTYLCESAFSIVTCIKTKYRASIQDMKRL